MEDSLILPAQLWNNQIILHIMPKARSAEKALHWIYAPDEEVFVLFQLYNCISYFTIWLPTDYEISSVTSNWFWRVLNCLSSKPSRKPSPLYVVCFDLFVAVCSLVHHLLLSITRESDDLYYLLLVALIFPINIQSKYLLVRSLVSAYSQET